MGEVRQTEARLRVVADAVPIQISYLDADLRYGFVNRAFLQWWGLEEREVIGHFVWEIIGETNHVAIRTYMERALGGESVQYENELTLSDGSARVVSVSHVPDLDDSGRVCGFYDYLTDVTEQRCCAEQVQVHREEVARASRLSLMGEMAAGFAHELNQPLGAICTYAAAMEEMGAAGAFTVRTETLGRITTEARRAAAIIDRIQRFIRKGPSHRSTIDINTVVREAVALVDSEARRHGIAPALDLSERVPALAVDTIQIQQVLLNLMRNSMEAMEVVPRTQRSITLRTRCPDADTVLILVEDSGPGLSPAAQSRAFEPFFTTKSSGTGLGLTISRRFVEDHGGRLWATKNEHGGASFHLTLPVKGDRSHGTCTTNHLRRR